MKPAKLFLAVIVAGTFIFGMTSTADAQYPIAVVPVQPVAPVVVGYTAQRRGLFGRRTVYRPVVTAVPVGPATALAPVSVARPVAVARPVTVARPVIVTQPITVARPVITTPVRGTTYRVPTVPVLPVQTYRIPVTPVFVW